MPDNMDLRDRALRALGWEPDPDGETMYELDGDGCRSIPAEETLIGMLLLELDGLTKGEFSLNGSYGGLQRPLVSVHAGRPQYPGSSILEALALAVEAAKEAK